MWLIPNSNYNRIFNSQTLNYFVSFQDHEGMIGLSLQALLDYINSDNINGLRSFLPNKHVQVR